MTTLLERYVQGEHKRVWEELVAFGEEVRDEPLYTDAVAVARETMRRARSNIEALIPRLAAVGYQFGYGWIQPAPSTAFDWRQRAWYRERLRWAHTQPPILRLATDVLEEMADRRQRLARLHELGAARVLIDHQEQQIAALEAQTPVTATLDEFERVVGTLPVSVRIWYETVEQVNFVGAHAAWLRFVDPDNPEEAEDRLEEGGSPFCVLRPLSIHPIDPLRLTGAPGAGSRRAFPFIPNEYAAYGETGQQAFDYELAVPCRDADAQLQLDQEETTFVAHLRECFRWGGFRGWALQDRRPEQDLAFLTRDLLPI